MIDTQLHKGTLHRFIIQALKADNEEQLWQLYLRSDGKQSFVEWKEEKVKHNGG